MQSISTGVAGLPRAQAVSSIGSEWRKVRGLWRQLRRYPNLLAGGLLVLGLVCVAVTAPLLAPYDPLQLNPDATLAGPSPDHLLGTDQLGRDILSRVIFGARVSLTVGAATMLLASVVGVPLGLAAGYFGGWWDMLIMRFVDIMLAFPFLIFALLMIIVLGNGSQNVVIALGVAAIPLFGRLVRSSSLSLAQRDYVSAARVLGASHARILIRHVLPNALGPIIVTASLLVAAAVLAEASLSYLGLGTQPPTPSWGLDLNRALGFLEVNIWMALGPGLAILMTATAFNLFGDGLRDLFDPRLLRTGKS